MTRVDLKQYRSRETRLGSEETEEKVPGEVTC